MNYSAIAVRYAKALFALAEEKKIVDDIYQDIKVLFSVCKQEPDFIRLLEFPVIPASKKIEIFRILFEGKIKPETLKFLNLIAENKRESYLPAMTYAFLDFYKNKQNIKTVTITTVEPIDDATRVSIHDIIKKQYHAGIELIEQKDDRLIGGFILRIDDEQFDASVANQLEKIKRELINK